MSALFPPDNRRSLKIANTLRVHLTPHPQASGEGLLLIGETVQPSDPLLIDHLHAEAISLAAEDEQYRRLCEEATR
jgi:hypothetical protein